jgi:hypothetical protein
MTLGSHVMTTFGRVMKKTKRKKDKVDVILLVDPVGNMNSQLMTASTVLSSLVMG